MGPGSEGLAALRLFNETNLYVFTKGRAQPTAFRRAPSLGAAAGFPSARHALRPGPKALSLTPPCPSAYTDEPTPTGPKGSSLPSPAHHPAPDQLEVPNTPNIL